jgi:hypothetical protein
MKLRDELISATEKRFQHVYRILYYVVATAIDPHYKYKYFKPDIASFANSEVLKLIYPLVQNTPETAFREMILS